MHPEALQQALAPYTGELGPGCLAQVGGGSINHSFVLTSCAGRQFFLKTNVAARLAMFEAEADGLAELAAAAAVRVPAAIASGIAGDRCWLLLEYLELGSGGERAAGTLGRQLASQHRRTAGHFGWHRDNTIGSTPQSNTPGESWADFFRDQRLAPQLQLVGATGASSRLLDLGARTCAAVPSLLADHRPAPALLHGDLWGGNWAETRDGRLVILAMMGGRTVESVDLRSLFSKRAHLLFTTLRSRSLSYKIDLTQDFAAQMLPLFEEGRLRPVIDTVMDWQDVQDAHRRMGANKNIGKIVLQVNGAPGSKRKFA